MEEQQQQGEINCMTSEEIKAKLTEAFGEEIANAFADEEINCHLGISDLLGRDADSSIFTKRGLNYGKVLRFKRVFAQLTPRAFRARVKTAPAPSVKPSVVDLAEFSPDLRRQYLSKRKRVGVLASEHWKNKYPTFNTPERKAELKDFAQKVSSDCSLPEAGFYTEGIEEHVKTFFNEQRRFQKGKKKNAVPCSPSGSTSTSGDEIPSASIQDG